MDPSVPDNGYAAIDRLQALAEANGATIYNINAARRAGWGITFYEVARDPNPNEEMGDSWRQGLVTYSYRPTLREAVELEIGRLEAAASAKPDSGTPTNGN